MASPQRPGGNAPLHSYAATPRAGKRAVRVALEGLFSIWPALSARSDGHLPGAGWAEEGATEWTPVACPSPLPV